MKARSFKALGVGIASQAFALASYIWLAKFWPESPLKHVGFLLLALGCVVAAWLLAKQRIAVALACLALLSLSAPIILTLGVTNMTTLSESPMDYLLYYTRVSALAFCAYGICWAAFLVINAALSRRTSGNSRPEATT
jgi:hypothetical protein